MLVNLILSPKWEGSKCRHEGPGYVDYYGDGVFKSNGGKLLYSILNCITLYDRMVLIRYKSF